MSLRDDDFYERHGIGVSIARVYLPVVSDWIHGVALGQPLTTEEARGVAWVLSLLTTVHHKAIGRDLGRALRAKRTKGAS